MPFTAEDAQFMAQAIRLAERGMNSTHPNPRVGCVLVRDGAVVGEGWHEWAGGPHAEVLALRDAGDAARGATAYVSLEPCSHYGRTPPCVDGLVAAGVSRVIAAMTDPNPLVSGKGMEILAAADIETAVGLLEAEAKALNRGFCKRMATGMPWVTSKLAMSLDGRTALASGESRWITGPEARHDVHRLRARSSAILTGIGTVLADDPFLTARYSQPPLTDPLQKGEGIQGIAAERQPARVVVDSHFRLQPTAKLIAQPGRTLVLGLQTEAREAEKLRDAGAEIHLLPAGLDERVDLNAAMELLGQLEFNEVIVEAGATLNGELLRDGLVDEWVVYLAPCVLGDRGRGLFHLPDLERMSDRYEMNLKDVRRVGKDVRMILCK
ncbi:MAG: bifunctional diaminohydroxyphosphoribosylaminopyrimidine deaminase/5-amino-6-(5-phosphoribosylamino)uracil reductase RibD [Candidatus Methylumidiphilus alinenensis]|uniref:Riboflavin biosynthesis protein RibD n=1 Tax=Candidatus Methylumidiphilus alinenensis TaxID=2202197 RepID=A0A2W4SR77_9GAMM|nr:MAG: bifunctional diaminohydroxyphosphoribosylaminopyrimidine deaminase/5-amino-6-(5-phosphoribosylamino)uracil reductase RibD [Candidatus Methylumidiphilus alinenensis]